MGKTQDRQGLSESNATRLGPLLPLALAVTVLTALARALAGFQLPSLPVTVSADSEAGA